MKLHSILPSVSLLAVAALCLAPPLARGQVTDSTTMANLPVQKLGANIASAANLHLEAATGDLVHVTGTVSVTALGTVMAGREVCVIFDGALTLTHNASSLILPAAANITTAANDCGIFRSLGSGNWICISYSPGAGGTGATLAGAEELTNKTITAQVVKTGLTASGSASNDFSSSTGTFKTSTGANTLGGDVTVAANKDLSFASGDGALDASLGTGITKTTSGLNTIGGKMAVKTIATPVAAAGSTVADAGQLGSANVVTVSSDGATKGVKLQTGVAGDVIQVINTSSTACELYAASGGTVNGLSADASIVLPASKGVICICTAADTWVVYDMTAKATAS